MATRTAIFLCMSLEGISMRKAYRYRLYPTKAQQTTLDLTLELCRKVYNDTLALWKHAWDQENRSISLYETNKHLTQ